MASEAEFKEYIERRLHEKDLFEREFIGELQETLSQLPVGPRSEPAYLASFASLAGGWQTKVGRKLVGDLDVRSTDDLDDVDLSPLVEDAEHHPHRHVNYHEVDKALRSLTSLTYGDGEGLGVSGFIEEMYEAKQQRGSSEAFDRALESLQDVDTFGRLGAFDYLEVLTRAHEHDWIAPDQLRRSHIASSEPKAAFEQIYDVSVEDASAQRHLDGLQRWAQLEQGMTRIESVFDIESCLCLFESEQNDDASREDTCT